MAFCIGSSVHKLLQQTVTHLERLQLIEGRVCQFWLICHQNRQHSNICRVIMKRMSTTIPKNLVKIGPVRCEIINWLHWKIKSKKTHYKLLDLRTPCMLTRLKPLNGKPACVWCVRWCFVVVISWCVVPTVWRRQYVRSLNTPRLASITFAHSASAIFQRHWIVSRDYHTQCMMYVSAVHTCKI